jgi:hypothetical protein
MVACCDLREGKNKHKGLDELGFLCFKTQKAIHIVTNSVRQILDAAAMQHAGGRADCVGQAQSR